MKKKKIKKLTLKKDVISNFKAKSIKGGASDSPTYCQACGSGTCGNCIQTWADPGCLTGIKWLCPLQ